MVSAGLRPRRSVSGSATNPCVLGPEPCVGPRNPVSRPRIGDHSQSVGRGVGGGTPNGVGCPRRAPARGGAAPRLSSPAAARPQLAARPGATPSCGSPSRRPSRPAAGPLARPLALSSSLRLAAQPPTPPPNRRLSPSGNASAVAHCGVCRSPSRPGQQPGLGACPRPPARGPPLLTVTSAVITQTTRTTGQDPPALAPRRIVRPRAPSPAAPVPCEPRQDGRPCQGGQPCQERQSAAYAPSALTSSS